MNKETKLKVAKELTKLAKELVAGGAIKRVLQHPISGKKIKTIAIRGGDTYAWNTVYKVYNGKSNYDQLQEDIINDIDWNKSK